MSDYDDAIAAARSGDPEPDEPDIPVTSPMAEALAVEGILLAEALTRADIPRRRVTTFQAKQEVWLIPTEPHKPGNMYGQVLWKLSADGLWVDDSDTPLIEYTQHGDATIAALRFTPKRLTMRDGDLLLDGTPIREVLTAAVAILAQSPR